MQNSETGLTNPNELIKITITNDGKKIVSAKDLYDFLEISTPFHIWCVRMLDYGFEEGFDYLTNKNVRQVPHQGSYRNVETTDYLLTLDTAKEIAMLQRSFKGKQVRKYFIKAEETLRTIVAEQTILPPAPEPVKVIERVITAKEFNALVQAMFFNDTRYYRLRDVQRLIGVAPTKTPKGIRQIMAVPNQKHTHTAGVQPRHQAVYVDTFALTMFLQSSPNPLAKQILNILNAQKS